MNGYLRFPHLHGDLVTFVAADDVWLAPVDGGRAWRLTDDHAPARNPRFSPDGRHIAWSSVRDGHLEAMVADVATGGSRRLTWLGAQTLVLGWSPDGRVLFASDAGEYSINRTTSRAVDLDGTVTTLPFGPVSGIAMHPDGAVVVSTANRRMPEQWKRYRGGTASRLWLSRGEGDWQRLLPEETAALVHPVWVGDTLVFASDLEAGRTPPENPRGQANLWALDPLAANGSAPRRLTAHTETEGYVRTPTTDGRRLAYHALGHLYVMDSPDDAPRRLQITLPGAVSGRASRLLDPKQNLDAVRPDHGCDASVITWRGTAVLLTHRDGPARVLSGDSDVRLREPDLLGRTGFAVLAGDRDGVDGLEVHSLTGTEPRRTLAAGEVGRVLHLTADPAGARVATVSHDGRVGIVDVASGGVRQVGHSPNGEALDPVFSPDGRYLVWSQPMLAWGHHQLMAVDLSAEAPAAVTLTSGRFHDTSPSFSRCGKYLIFLSARTFDPVYDDHSFDLGFTGSTRPYLVPLAATEPPPFGPSADGWRISGPEPAKPLAGEGDPANGKPGDPAPEPGPTLDVDGFEDRMVPFPVPASRYAHLRSAKDGVLWLHRAARGALGTARAGSDELTDAIEFFSFTKREVTEVASRATGFDVSGDGARMVVRDGSALSVRPVDRLVKPDDDDHVRIDTDRVRVAVDPVAQWRQMFDENGRIMRDHFWRADLGGVDWAGVLARYRPLIDRLAGQDDLVDLLWEVVAELNTSHAYVMPPVDPSRAGRRLGLLGADLERTATGWRIAGIVPGESSDPAARSPLRAAGVDARVGDELVAVNGQPVPPEGPWPLLLGTADRPVELTLRRAEGFEGSPEGVEGASGERRVVVVPLSSQDQLRYHAWVADRRAHVTAASGGRLGYLHLPDMMGLGWAQFHRDLALATACEGLIVDVRYNRGGHISSLVIERIARQVLGWEVGRHLADSLPYPENAPRGPVVLVANQWSGSDGDIVNVAAQALGLGPVIGERTWGGVVGIDGRFDLVDGTEITQPRYALWFTGPQWGVENHGVDPDIEVVMTPGDFGSGADPQLDRAVAEALDRLASSPAARPPGVPSR